MNTTVTNAPITTPAAAEKPIVNISFYKFLNMPSELQNLREEFLALAQQKNLKGTILLAPEGINAFYCGVAEDVSAFSEILKQWIRNQDSDVEVRESDFKISASGTRPFKRMLVKLKKEIISMGIPSVKPKEFTGKRVTAKELKDWYDNQKDMVILDTRNDYELRLGTFKNAIDLNLQTFRQFPQVIKQLPEDMKDKTVVTFCTGGIRCEKATAALINEGFKNVYQLDGGILKYFEEVGGDHYNGDCFVFDYRVAVDPKLNQTDAVICYNCQNPITGPEQRSPEYVYGKSCPYCFNKPKTHKEQIAKELSGRS